VSITRTLDLFATGFVSPEENAPGAIAASTTIAGSTSFTLIDDGTIPASAIIQSVQLFASAGSLTPGVLPAGIQPYYKHAATEWAGPGNAVPPTFGGALPIDDTEVISTVVLGVNPITAVAWTRTDLFTDLFGWWSVWVNTGTIPYTVQTSSITEFFVRVVYTVPTTPTPVIGSIALAGLTVIPETYTFRLDGNNFDPDIVVLLTQPSLAVVSLSGADIISVEPTRVQFLTDLLDIGIVGAYTVQVRNPTGALSNTLAFTLLGPGVIQVTPPGGIHWYGYAFVRPVTPNTTNAPLGLAPGASIFVYDSGTLTQADIFTDEALTIPIVQPIVADANGFYSFYTTPEAVALQDHRVDLAFSGGGILVPYTVGDAIPYDPRIVPLEIALATLNAALVAGLAALATQITQQQQVPLPFPLGGSLTVGGKNATAFKSPEAVAVVLDSTLLGGYGVNVIGTAYTENAGTSVTVQLRDESSNVVGTSSAIVATSPTVFTFAVTLTAGSHTYSLWMLPSNANAFIYSNGYLFLAA